MTEGYPDRIISKEEIRELMDLLSYQKLDYPNYEKWIKDTIADVKIGVKKAFGLFTEKLVGDGVIRITASNTVELKNFYIHPDFREKGNGTRLLEYIEEYCKKHGYSQISIDAYVDEPPIVSFLIKNGFYFQARGDFYGMGKESYLLVKKLPPSYIGGYDWIEISKWVIERLWGFSLKDELNNDCYVYNKSEEDLKIICTFLIIDDLNNEVDENRLKSFFQMKDRIGMTYCFAPFFSDEANQFAIEKGIVLIDINKLEELSGLELPRSYGEIAGFIIVIKPGYFEKLLEKKDRVYIRGGKIPNGVEKDQVLLFYVSSPISGIKGNTIIQNLTCEAPSNLWNKYSRQSAFSNDEYKTYTLGKTDVTAFSFDDINELSKPISIDQIRSIVGGFNHQTGQKITVKEWEKIRKLI